MMPMAMFGLGVPELLIILAVVLLLFGGSRLAGLGKSTGRALKEFKEETKGLKPGETAEGAAGQSQVPQSQAGQPQVTQPQSGQPQVNEESIAPTWQQPPKTPAQNPDAGDVRKDA